MADAGLAVRLYPGSLQVAVIEANGLELEVPCGMLAGLGIRRLARCNAVEEAQEGLLRDGADLVVLGSAPGSPGECGMIGWVRRDAPAAMRAVQTGHTQRADVLRARDASYPMTEGLRRVVGSIGRTAGAATGPTGRAPGG